MERKKGQVTIFIIIAVIVVAAGVMIYLFVPQIRTSLGTTTENPSDFFETCIIDSLRDNVETISLQGGSMEPEHAVNYKGKEIEYLCYTNRDFVLCSVQQPFLKKHVENELKESIEEEASECFNLLRESFHNRGYDVSVNHGAIEVELIPQRIVAKFNTEVVLTKGDSERYEEFVVVLNNNLYELVGIAISIIEKETTLGNAELLIYRNIYGGMEFEIDRFSEGTKIYILTDRERGDSFRFASRSLVHSPGVGEIQGIEVT